MGQVLKHPASAPRPNAPEAAAQATVRLFGADGHIRPMSEIEADLIRLALCMNEGSVSLTARDLAVSEQFLSQRLLDAPTVIGGDCRPCN